MFRNCTKMLTIEHIYNYNCINKYPNVLFIFDMYSSTFIMGQRTGFNRQLNDTTKRFTYFVPRDWAWQQTETEFPSLYKKLFMPEYEYHVS